MYFTVVKNGRRLATPLLLVLVLVEATDGAFATDSIPAVLTIPKNAFVVYTSKVFAVLGFRSLYFVLAGVIGGFRYVNYGLALVLSFIKMLIAGWCAIPTGASLAASSAFRSSPCSTENNIFLDRTTLSASNCLHDASRPSHSEHRCRCDAV
ncbi:MAG: TerC family protein [Terriglobia bacterium]